VLTVFPRERRWLLPALRALQDAHGHLSLDALAAAGAHLRVPASEVYGVATSYPELRLRPHGRHHIRVCTGVTCALAGAHGVLDSLVRRFEFTAQGEATPVASGTAEASAVARAPDGMTIEACDCFFACSVSPLVEIDGALRGRVEVAGVAGIERWLGRAESGEVSSRRTASDVSVAPGGEGRARPDVTATAADTGARGGDRPVAGGDAAAAGGRDPGSAAVVLDRLVADARRRRSARPSLRLLVQMGTCGRAVGGDVLFETLRDAVARRGLSADVVRGACNGMCYAAPLVGVERSGWPRFVVERLAPSSVDAFLDRLAADPPAGDRASGDHVGPEAVSPSPPIDHDDAGHGDGSRGPSFVELGLSGVVWADEPWRGLVPVGRHPFWQGQERVLLRRAGRIDPESLDDALADGAYRSLARVLDGPPERVIAEVKASGLQGRGGAFFPAAVKWEACRNAPGEPKYLVMNGEEGEPGIFKDRHLMEADPHQVLEGALIAAYAAGATRVVLYVHGEADLAAASLVSAVEDAEAAGIIGERMLGHAVACAVEVRRGAGGFVLGEETALLESIEGRRAQPRTRPPFPVESGLWGRPTVINNVETLAAVPAIVERGAESFVALGTSRATGTKVFGLSGAVVRPGVVEVRNGVTLAALLQRIGGGSPDARPLAGALVGGPSGSLVPASLFDVPMEPRQPVSPGTGGIVAIPEDASVVDIVRTLLAFNARESCGKCTPCREGAPRLLAMLDELVAAGRDTADRDPGARADAGRDSRGQDAPDRHALLARIRDLGETMQLASLCGLGQAAPVAFLKALDTFPSAFGLEKETA
jgi:NADH-quinone oxidoreductase subunit F